MFFDTDAKLKSPTLSVADKVRILSCDRNITSPPPSLAGTNLVELATDIGNHQAEELSVHAGYGTTYPEGYNPENVDTLDRRNWINRNVWSPIINTPKNIEKVWDDTKQMFVDKEESDVKKDVYGREMTGAITEVGQQRMQGLGNISDLISQWKDVGQRIAYGG